MIKITGKCITCNLKHTNFNYKDEIKPLYCKYYKICDMVDVRNKNVSHVQISIINMKKAIIL